MRVYIMPKHTVHPVVDLQCMQEVKKIERTDLNQADITILEAKFTASPQLAGHDEHILISSITGRPMPKLVTPETVFGAASLSKPMFAYLVLKLIEANKANTAEPGSGKFLLPDGVTHFDLDTPLYHILPLEKLTIEGMSPFDASDPSAVSSAQTLTARMVLSHQTGLAHGEMKFQFQPEKPEPGELGKGHGYSNAGILYLQKVIDKLTELKYELALMPQDKPLEKNKLYVSIESPNLKYTVLDATTGALVSGVIALDTLEFELHELKDTEALTKYLPKILEETAKRGHTPQSHLEVLAKKHVFDPLEMRHSSFIADKNKPLEASAPNSLHTTASDYAKFLNALMHDDALQDAFTPHVFMTKDKGMAGAIRAVEESEGKIQKNDLEHVAWGLGWGLQTDDKGEVTSAYHSGDMTGVRAWVAMNIKDKTAMVYFSNSHNGHILAEQIMPTTIELKHAVNYFFPKWGFARNLDELGGVTNNFGLRASPVIQPPTSAAEIHDVTQTAMETTQPAPLGEAQEVVQTNPELPKWQSKLIDHLFNTIKNNYIFPEKIDEAAFKKLLTEGFAAINLEFPSADKEKFCSEMNKILSEIDPHLIVQFDPAQIADHKNHGRIVMDPRENGGAKFALQGLEPPSAWYEKFKRENYGFEQDTNDKSFAVPDTMGYVKINDFLDPRDGLGHLAQEKAHQILESMQGKEAIIIDLRDSHGGSPEMVEYIISYLLTETDKAKITGSTYNTIYDSSTGTTTEYKVRPTEFSLNVPVYVLTNEATFSAAEEFAYDLQQINAHALGDGRFTIVGQTTKGGAHAMTGFPLMDANTGAVNDEYFLWVPTRTTINPYTHTNWEDGPKKGGERPGVQPDIAVKDDQNSLEIALRMESMRPRPAPSRTATVDQDTTSQFKGRLREIMPVEPNPVVNIEDKSSITPFKTTPKPTELD